MHDVEMEMMDDHILMAIISDGDDGGRLFGST
jgi:hypothetical protein